MAEISCFILESHFWTIHVCTGNKGLKLKSKTKKSMHFPVVSKKKLWNYSLVHCFCEMIMEKFLLMAEKLFQQIQRQK